MVRTKMVKKQTLLKREKQLRSSSFPWLGSEKVYENSMLDIKSGHQMNMDAAAQLDATKSFPHWTRWLSIPSKIHTVKMADIKMIYSQFKFQETGTWGVLTVTVD